MRTVWQDSLSPEEWEALDPGPPDELDPTPDVLVVGGGAVGLATAAACRRAGVGRVTLIERDRLAAGASGSAAAALSPELHSFIEPEPFVDFGRASLDLHRELDVESGGGTGLRPLDWLVPVHVGQLAPSPPGSPFTSLDGDAARRREPQLGDCAGALLFEGQARLHPLRLALTLSARAGTVATGVSMLSIETAGDRVVEVATSHGPVSPEALVLCTGVVPEPWHHAVPGHAVKGHLLATVPAPFRLNCGVGSAILVLQLDDNRLVAGGTLDTGDESPDVRPEVVELIRSDMAALLPATRGLEVDHAWCCFRPGTPDGLPVIDQLPGVANAWVNVGHYRTGVLMAPAAGRAIASWVMSGHRPPELHAFTADRLAATSG